MRKAVLFLLFLVCSSVFVSADYVLVSQTTGNSLDIKAVMSPEASLTVELEPEVMPFYLTDESIIYDPGKRNNGFAGTMLVGIWTLVANTSNIVVEVDADPLVHTEDPAADVDYFLYLKINDTEGIEVDTSYDMPVKFSSFLQKGESDKALSIAHQSIYFMLAEGIYITSENFPAGDYKANVKITVTAGGDL